MPEAPVVRMCSAPGQEGVEKPYVCRLCNIEQRFEQEFSLKCHLKLVHGQDPEVSSSAERSGTVGGELGLHDPTTTSHKHNGLDTEGDLDGPSPAKLPKLAASDADNIDNKSAATWRRRGARSRTPTTTPSGGENTEGITDAVVVNSRRSPRAKVQKQLSDESLASNKEKDTGAVSTENIRVGRLRNRKTSESQTKTTITTMDSQQQQPVSKKTAKSVATTVTAATTAAVTDDNMPATTTTANGRNSSSSKKNTRAGRGASKK